MKKLLLTLAVLCGTVSAWAQSWNYATNVVIGNKITDLSSIEDGQKVVFKLVSTNTYITLDSKADADMSASVSGLSVFSLHKGTGENESKFSIESSKEGFYFPEITKDGGWKEYIMTETPVYYEFLTKTSDDVALSSGQFVIKCSTATGYFDGNSSDFTAWQGKGANSKYEIYAVNALYYFKDAYDLFQSGFYSVQCPNKSNVYAMFDGTRITYNGKKDNTKSVFYFEKGDDNKYTIRLSDGRYITYKGTGTGDQIEFKLPAEATDANKWWQICSGKVGGRFVIVPDQQEISNSTPGFNFAVSYKKEGDATADANGALGLWNCDDNNSQWVIAPSAPMFAQGKAKIKVQNIFLKKEGDYLRQGDTSNFELFTFTKDSEKNRYTIQTSDGTYLTYSGTGNGTQVAFAEATDENKWWIIEANNGLASGAAYPVDIYPYTESFNKDNPAWNFAISVDKQPNQAVGFWDASDKNSYCELFWEIESSLTDVAENVHEMTEYGVAGFFDPTLSGAAGYTLSNNCWIDNKFTADIDFGFPVSKVGGQTYATMISSFSGSNFKWYANGTGVNAQKAVLPTSANVVNYLWAIYPSFTEGSFSFTIKNIGAGKYISSTSADNSHNAGVVVLADEGSAFTYESSAQFKLSTGKYLSLNSSGIDNVQIIGTWGSHDGTKNSFPASVVSVAIGEAEYSTVYLPFAVTLPAEVKAYAVESVGGSYATLSEAKTTIPANTGAILNATASTYTLNAGEAEEWSDNLLEGSSVNTYVEGPAYVLSKVDDVVGMYKALLNKNGAGESGTTHFLNNAGKAYLPATAGGAARFLVFDFGTETGIDELKGENGNVKAEIYDLSGRRVQNAQKGLYIVNGKKVVR